MTTEGNESQVNTSRESVMDGQKKDASTSEIASTPSVLSGGGYGSLGQPTVAHDTASPIPCRCGCVPPNMMSLFQMAELRASRKKEKLAQEHADGLLLSADATYVKEE